MKYLFLLLCLCHYAYSQEQYTVNANYTDSAVKVFINNIPLIYELDLKKGKNFSSQKELAPFLIEGENILEVKSGIGEAYIMKTKVGAFPDKKNALAVVKNTGVAKFKVSKSDLKKLSWFQSKKLSKDDCAKGIKFAEQIKAFIDNKKPKKAAALHVEDIKNSMVLYPDFGVEDLKSFNLEKYTDLVKKGYKKVDNFECHLQTGDHMLAITSPGSHYFLEGNSKDYEIFLFLALNEKGQLEIVY